MKTQFKSAVSQLKKGVLSVALALAAVAPGLAQDEHLPQVKTVPFCSLPINAVDAHGIQYEVKHGNGGVIALSAKKTTSTLSNETLTRVMFYKPHAGEGSYVAFQETLTASDGNVIKQNHFASIMDNKGRGLVKGNSEELVSVFGTESSQMILDFALSSAEATIKAAESAAGCKGLPVFRMTGALTV